MSTTSIIFTQATQQDSQLIDDASKIWAQAAAQRDHKPLPKDGSGAIAGVERRLALPDARLTVASKGGVAAGFTLCSPHDGYLEIYYVAVAPDFWGQRIASELLTEMDFFAHKTGFQELRLWVISDNSRAINLYQANGFRHTGQEQADESSGRVEFLLSKTKF